MAKFATKWSNAMDTIVRIGYEKGTTARIIAAEINKLTGKNLSKNAVIGRASRLGLQSKAHTSALTRSELEYVRKNGLGSRPFLEQNRPDMDESGLGKTCQYIHGDPKDREFCGAEVWEPGASYCVEHHMLCYRKPNDNEKRLQRLSRRYF